MGQEENMALSIAAPYLPLTTATGRMDIGWHANAMTRQRQRAGEIFVQSSASIRV
jgi:hypothetical protein